MRYFNTGQISSSLTRTAVLFFLLMILLFWASSALMFFQRMSFDPTSVMQHYLGKPSEWGGPVVGRSYKVMLEVSHAHLFAMGMLLLTLTHLLIFVPVSPRLKIVLTSSAFLSALCNEGSGWLIRFVSPQFAYFKLLAFACFQLSMAALVLMLISAFIRPAGKR
ncbi:MAG: hypothetical protein H6707_20625 [Deltaproteobacteria bacterium]|nr:hypothetical protein [Deltaproteobacteria bacterium]